MKKLTFLILLAACAVAISPADAKSKAAVSGSASVAGAWVFSRSRVHRAIRRDKLAEGELELATKSRKIATSEREVSALKTKLAEELRSLELQKKDAEQAIALREKDIHFLKAELEKETEYKLRQVEVEAERRAEEGDKQLKAARKKAADRIRQVRRKGWEMRRELIERGELDAQDLEAEIREELASEMAIAREELAKGKAENEKLKADLEAEIEETHAELQEIMNSTLKRSLDVLEAQKEKEKAEWMVSFVQKYDATKKEIGNLKSRIRLLQQELSDQRDIKLCREVGVPHADRANDVLVWLKTRHGIYANWIFSSIDEYGVFRMGFDLWTEDPANLKKLERLMPLLSNRLGCPEPPTVAFGNDATCYILTALPRNARVETGTKLEDIYKRSLPDIDLPPGFSGLEASLRDQVANELTFQAEQEFMLSYVPPTPLKPRSQSISGEEMNCYRYFMYYRAEATKGVEPNVTTKNELMQLIYGVSPGYSAYQRKDSVLMETLSQRYDRVMLMLGTNEEIEQERKNNEIY